MASGTELSYGWEEGFEKKDSSKLAELLTDDFQMVSRPGTRSKQETLSWTSADGNSSAIDNIEVLYENDEVAVVQQSANNGKGDGTATGLYQIRMANSPDQGYENSGYQRLIASELVCRQVDAYMLKDSNSCQRTSVGDSSKNLTS